MASFSRSLDECLHSAIALATERDHELATLEHLLLALTDDRGLSPDIEKLKGIIWLKLEGKR